MRLFVLTLLYNKTISAIKQNSLWLTCKNKWARFKERSWTGKENKKEILKREPLSKTQDNYFKKYTVSFNSLIQTSLIHTSVFCCLFIDHCYVNFILVSFHLIVVLLLNFGLLLVVHLSDLPNCILLLLLVFFLLEGCIDF